MAAETTTSSSVEDLLPISSSVRSSILSFLPPRDIVSASTINTPWRDEAAQSRAWDSHVRRTPMDGHQATLRLESAAMYYNVLQCLAKCSAGGDHQRLLEAAQKSASGVDADAENYVQELCRFFGKYDTPFDLCRHRKHFPMAHVLLRMIPLKVERPLKLREGSDPCHPRIIPLAMVANIDIVTCDLAAEFALTTRQWILSFYRFFEHDDVPLCRFAHVPAAALLSIPADKPAVDGQMRQQVFEITNAIIEKWRECVMGDTLATNKQLTAWGLDDDTLFPERMTKLCAKMSVTWQQQQQHEGSEEGAAAGEEQTTNLHEQWTERFAELQKELGSMIPVNLAAQYGNFHTQFSKKKDA